MLPLTVVKTRPKYHHRGWAQTGGGGDWGGSAGRYLCILRQDGQRGRRGGGHQNRVIRGQTGENWGHTEKVRGQIFPFFFRLKSIMLVIATGYVSLSKAFTIELDRCCSRFNTLLIWMFNIVVFWILLSCYCILLDV